MPIIMCIIEVTFFFSSVGNPIKLDTVQHISVVNCCTVNIVCLCVHWYVYNLKYSGLRLTFLIFVKNEKKRKLWSKKAKRSKKKWMWQRLLSGVHDLISCMKEENH